MATSNTENRQREQTDNAPSKDEVLPGSPDSLGQDTTMPVDEHAWDASRTLPSQWGKRKGSVYATPASRDGHVDSSKARDKSFHDKLKEKGWFK